MTESRRVSVTLHLYAEGPAFAVYAMGYDGQADLFRFLDREKERHPNDYVDMVARLEQVADDGPPRDWRVSRQVSKDPTIYELKAGKLRVFWFYDGHRRRAVIVTHGWGNKGTKKEQQAQIRLACQKHDVYQRATAKNDVRIIEE